MVQPEELKSEAPLLWSPGTGTDVWALFCACTSGDLATVTRLIDANPSLVRAHFEYRTPLYFAVRENQIAVVTVLLERGAEPFWNGDDLVEMARIRGHRDIEALIESKRPAGPPPSIAIMNSDTTMIELLASHGAIWTIPVQLADS